MPQSFRNEEAVLRVLLLPTQIPLTKHVLIPTSCGYVGIGFYWLLPVPFSSKLPSSTRDPQLLPQEAAQEQEADRVTKASPLPQGGTTCTQFTGAIHTPEWNLPANGITQKLNSSRDHSLIQLFPCFILPLSLPLS